MRLFIILLSLLGVTAAVGQDNGCGAAVEYGKGVVNACIDKGYAECRTQRYLDDIWAKALSDRYVLTQGGCTMSNKLYFYMGGSPTSSSSDDIVDARAQPSHQSPSQMEQELQNANAAGQATQDKLAGQLSQNGRQMVQGAQSSASNNSALNPFGSQNVGGGGGSGHKAGSGPRCALTDNYGQDCVTGCRVEINASKRPVLYCQNICPWTMQVNYLRKGPSDEHHGWGTVQGNDNKVVDVPVGHSLSAESFQCP